MSAAALTPDGWMDAMLQHRRGSRAMSGRRQREGGAATVAKNTICFWYDKDAEAAARFYVETFLESTMGVVYRAPADHPSGKAGYVLTVRSP